MVQSLRVGGSADPFCARWLGPVKADACFGDSHIGANLYGPNTPGMKGWQLALQVRPIPFVGVEGDLFRYGANAGAGSQHPTPIMFGPCVTLHAAGFSVFAHALGERLSTCGRVNAGNPLRMKVPASTS